MSFRRLRAVARKEVLQIGRDPWSLGMAFAIPMTLLVLFGWVLSLDVEHLTTIVYDQDRTRVSRELIARFSRSGYFDVVASAARLGDVERALDGGRARVALVVPTNFARDLERGRAVSLQVLVDGSDSNIATIALSYIEAIVTRFAEQISVELGVPRRAPALEGRLRVWYNPDLESRNFIVPGLIAVIMMVIAAMLTSLTVAREWERGTMEQLIATPIRVPELVLGKLLPYLGIGFLDVALCALVGVFLFRVPFRGSVLLLILVSTAFLVGVLSLGLLISIRARTQLLASQIGILATLLPSLMLSGFAAPIENMPRWLQALTYAVPARYYVTALKGLFLKGVGPAALVAEQVFLAAFAVVMMLLAVRAFRKNLE
jgi:drug efflux transport system permease protein